jgi:hypothetical protein
VADRCKRRPASRDAPTLAGAAHPASEGIELSESGGTVHPEAHEGAEGDSVLLFVGGPLDGRVEVRPARYGEPLPTITHVYLHGGPKVVHRYDLAQVTEQGGVYHLRPSANRPVHDEVSD